MSKPSDPIIVLVTTPDVALADAIAEAAVDQRLAGSAQITPLRTRYRWCDRVHAVQEHEVRLFSRTGCFQALSDLVRSIHSYEVPQVVAVPIVGGTPDFLRWLERTTDSSDPA